MSKITEEIAFSIGYYGTKVVMYYSGVTVGMKVVKFVRNVACVHKINTSDPTVVTNNVFKCLKYID